MRRTTLRNVRVFATNRDNRDGFNIYLDFSGQREFLFTHRHNGLLYNLLKDGVRTEDLRRWTPRRGTASGQRLQGMVSHLLTVVDDYAAEREGGFL
ncbi:MAG: hypothetical protein IJR72_00660 [Oscillospiraceae bacterium]|nr:hypothetical protein [Oscillospiraceae bacterium]